MSSLEENRCVQMLLTLFLLLPCTHGYKPSSNVELRSAVKDWCSNAAAAQTKYGRHISEWDTSLITSLDDLFCSSPLVGVTTGYCHYGNTGCGNFNENIASWDVSQVTSMEGTFYAAISFNQDLSSWDVSKVTNMWWMFGYSLSFNQDLSSWNVGLVTNMEKLFYNALDFSQTICWDLNPVANTTGIVYGTYGASVNTKDSSVCGLKDAGFSRYGLWFAVLSVYIILLYFFGGEGQGDKWPSAPNWPSEPPERQPFFVYPTFRHKLTRCIHSGCSGWCTLLDISSEMLNKIYVSWFTFDPDRENTVFRTTVRYAAMPILGVIFLILGVFIVILHGLSLFVACPTIFMSIVTLMYTTILHVVPEICLFLGYYCWHGYPDNYTWGPFNRVWGSAFELVIRLVVYSIPIIGLGFYLPVLNGGPGVLLVSISVLVFLICLDERAYMQWLRGKTEREPVLPYQEREQVLQSEGEQQEEEEDREQIDALHMATTKGEVELVRGLVNAGVNVNGMNQDGHTPLYIALHHDDNDSTALQEKRQQVAALLVKAGALSD